MSTPSSPAATAARRAAEEIWRGDHLIGADTAIAIQQRIAAIILRHHAALPAHGDGTGGGANEAALREVVAAMDELMKDVHHAWQTKTVIPPSYFARLGAALLAITDHPNPKTYLRRCGIDPDKEWAKFQADLDAFKAATARADALGADKRRLDWLEKKARFVFGNQWTMYDTFKAEFIVDKDHGSLRAAIDAAMGEKPGQGRHLRYDLYTAPDNGEHRHPQAVMKSLGITYAHAIPQSLGDQWWFLDCENVPAALPPHITPMTLTDEEYRHWTAP